MCDFSFSLTEILLVSYPPQLQSQSQVCMLMLLLTTVTGYRKCVSPQMWQKQSSIKTIRNVLPIVQPFSNMVRFLLNTILSYYVHVFHWDYIRLSPFGFALGLKTCQFDKSHASLLPFVQFSEMQSKLWTHSSAWSGEIHFEILLPLC